MRAANETSRRVRSADTEVPRHLRAVIARRGLHDLMPWWSPDTDSMVDPLDDRETRASVRFVLAKLAKGEWPDA